MSDQGEGQTNSARFLLAFNRIERRLAEIGDVDDHRSFGEKLKAAARREPIVGHIQAELRELAELRNAIVHTDRMLPLAEPHDDIVAEIERYVTLLTDPPSVGSRFTRRVGTVREDDPVRLAVRLMRQRGYSQLPVRDQNGRIIALLTGATIARWLGALDMPAEHGNGGGTQGDVDLDTVTVARVLALADSDDNYVFLRPEATLYDALWEFESHQRAGRRLDAILLSRDGKPDQGLIGIITPRDLPFIVMEMEFPEG
jgi:CBS domain-containing protein